MNNKLLFLMMVVGWSAFGQQTITNVYTGTGPNKGDGDPARTAFIKLNTNDNFLQTQLTTLSNQVSAISTNGVTNLASTVSAGLQSTNSYILGTRYPRTFIPSSRLGWNPWNSVSVNNNEATTVAIINQIVNEGWRELGFRTIVLDDGWANPTRVNDHLVPDPVKWPHGIAVIANMCHTNGMFLGVYTETGNSAFTTSGVQPSSWNHYDMDCADFASWGVDHIKFTGFDDNGTTAGMEWNKTSFAAAAQRNIPGVILETSRIYWMSWPAVIANTVEPGYLGDMPNFDSMIAWVDEQTGHYWTFGGGTFPHMYIKMVNVPATVIKSQISFAAMMSAFYFVSDFQTAHRQYLTNQEIWAVQGDVRGECAHKIYSNNQSEVYIKRVAAFPTSQVVCMVNRDPSVPKTGTFSWTGTPGEVATIRDLWARSIVAYATNSWSTNLQPHDAVVVRVDPGVVPPFLYGTNFLSDYAFMPVWTNSWYTNAGGGNYGFDIYYNKSQGGNTLSLGGTNYPKGFGFAANSEFSYFLGGQATIFSFTAGIDDEINVGSGLAKIDIYTNGVQLATTVPLVSGTTYWTTNLNVTGATTLKIISTTTQVGGTDYGNHMDIVNPTIVCPYPKYGP